MTRGIFHCSLYFPLLPTVQGPHTLFSLACEGIYQGQTDAPNRHFFGAGDISKGKPRKEPDNMLDKIRDDQSFISVETDFSLMESCGVSAPNY